MTNKTLYNNIHDTNNVSTSHWDVIAQLFSSCHKNDSNVIVHLLTTPLGLIGALSIIRIATNSSSFIACLSLFYLLCLLAENSITNGVFAGTVFLSMIIVLACKKLNLNVSQSILFIVVGYVLQDISHFAFNEESMQSIYSGGGHVLFNTKWINDFALHTYYLLPLCINVALLKFAPTNFVPLDYKTFFDATLPQQMLEVYNFRWLLIPLVMIAFGSYCLDSKNSWCFFPGAPYFHRVLQCNLVTGDKDCNKKDLKTIRDWVMKNAPAHDTSSHWWYRDLDGINKEAFENCANSRTIYNLFRSLFSERHYCLETVTGMNEIYVTGPARSAETNNSDQVFYTRHVDGPWGLLPFVSVYRCIVGMDKNMMITTHFPLANLSVNACEGDLLAFDFNREVHYITCDESKRSISDDFRVVLKLHYCVYPRVLAPVGWIMHWLNVRYNIAFRALFLKTIKPETFYEHFLAFQVNFNTVLFDRIESILGQRSIFYLAFAGALWWTTGSYEVFFYMTSFAHYIRYITTFYIRKGIDFGCFKRDVLLFKTIALIQLALHYIFPQLHCNGLEGQCNIKFEFDIISILMIVSGYVVSILATKALGVDRTYFAAELGLVEPKWINEFPYGYIPHPMIVSQIWALLGLYKAAHFRANWPYVIPIHIAFYLAHMLQEELGIFKRYDDFTNTSITDERKSSSKKIKVN